MAIKKGVEVGVGVSCGCWCFGLFDGLDVRVWIRSSSCLCAVAPCWATPWKDEVARGVVGRRASTVWSAWLQPTEAEGLVVDGGLSESNSAWWHRGPGALGRRPAIALSVRARVGGVGPRWLAGGNGGA